MEGMVVNPPGIIPRMDSKSNKCWDSELRNHVSHTSAGGLSRKSHGRSFGGFAVLLGSAGVSSSTWKGAHWDRLTVYHPEN